MGGAGGQASRLPPDPTEGGGGAWRSGLLSGVHDRCVYGDGGVDGDGQCRKSLTDDLLLGTSSSGGNPSPAR